MYGGEYGDGGLPPPVEGVLPPIDQIVNSFIAMMNANGGAGIVSMRDAALDAAVQNVLQEECSSPDSTYVSSCSFLLSMQV